MRIKLIRKLAERSPVFYLTGGIGNQLFVYAAGKAFSKENNIAVKFDLSDVGKGFTNHGSSIQALSLDLHIAQGKSRFQMLKNRIFNKLDRISLKYRSTQIRSKANYRSNEIGFDAELLNKKCVRNVLGYFQSWKYIEMVHESFPSKEIILKAPSEWFRQMSELALTTKPIMIHVRRGDYKKLSDTYGLLSSDYYVTALQKVRHVLPKNPIWVLSDDVDEVRILFSKALPIETTWVNPPKGTDPVESLVLMSFGAANIIGNSTFSWWGAMLNRDSVVTIAPEKWFRGMNDPKDLYPPNWVLAPSSWQN